LTSVKAPPRRILPSGLRLETGTAAVRTCERRYRWATKQTMLYERWRQVADASGGQVALRELDADVADHVQVDRPS
jgi:hypothetical protein